MSAEETPTDDEQLGRMLFQTMKESYDTVELLAGCIAAAAGFLRGDRPQVAKVLLIAAETHLHGLAKLSDTEVTEAVENGTRVAVDTVGRFRRKDRSS